MSKIDQREEMPNTTPKNSDAINTTDEVQGEQKHRWWIVLPIVVVSMTIATVEPALMNDLMVRRFRYRYGILNGSSPSSESACNAPNLENNSQLIELSIKVQQSVSHLNILIAGVGAIPAVLTYVILGANCDRIGRRPLLIIPCLGRIIRYIILLILVQINLDDIWLIIADVVDGLFGSNSLLLLGAIAYISDCTNHQERGRAMILEEAAVALTRIFPLLGLGFWLQYHDYTLPMSICLGINVAALIYIYLFQPESYGPNKRELFHFVKQLKRVRLSAIRGTYRVFLTKRPGDNQRKLICLTVTQMSLFVILFGFVSIHALYLYGKPFCFNALDLAILTSAQFALMIFISIVLSFFQKSYLMNSLVIPIFGIFTYIIHLVIFGFAQRVWVLYLALFIGCLFFVVMGVLRSLLTKLVNESEFALVFIATGIVETIGSYVLGIVTNAIYAQTIKVYPGIIFFILAAIGIIPLALMGYLVFRSRTTRKTAAAERQEDSADDLIETKF